jgi:hypothetical protein
MIELSTNNRRFTSIVAALALVAAFFGGVAVQRVLAHDPSLDLALAALEKASALVQSALTDDITGLPDKTGHEVAKHLERAIEDIADASDEILQAIAFEDTP